MVGRAGPLWGSSAPDWTTDGELVWERQPPPAGRLGIVKGGDLVSAQALGTKDLARRQG